MRSVIKEVDPKNGGFPQTPQNGGFRMLLQVMKVSQLVQLPAATTVSSNESLDGCHFKIVPFQTLCDP